MQNRIFRMLLILMVCFSISSCYTYTYMVGDGPQTGIELKEKNHYFIAGLAPGGQSDPIKMAGDTQDYQVKIEHTFVDGLINILTFGIYTPTTTTIIK